MRNTPHYETEENLYQDIVVESSRGMAVRILGWETEPDEETEWSGYEIRTGRLVAVLVGDDYKFTLDPADVRPLAADGYCRECGQIGCASNTYE